jgi:hypothetical protein
VQCSALLSCAAYPCKHKHLLISLRARSCDKPWSHLL